MSKAFFYWFPVLLWAFVIFLFSANPTTRASEIHWQDFIVKKTAHIVEYGIFTLLLFRALRGANLNMSKAVVSAIIISIIYGATDEFHQSFTPGREPTLRDVIFDSIGSLLSGYFIFYLLPKMSNDVKRYAKRLQIV